MTTSNKTSDLKTAVEAIEVAPTVEVAGAKEVIETEIETKAQEAGNAILKTASRFNWMNVVGAGVITAAGTAANMVIVNKLVDQLELENDKYSTLEILGVTGVSTLVAAGAQAALNTSKAINNNDIYGTLSMSLVANATTVVSAYTRDSALAGIRNLLAKKDTVVESEAV